MILPQVHLRNGLWGAVHLPLVSQGARLYLKQEPGTGLPTHFHLVCGRSPYPWAGRRGFAADCPSSLPVAELSGSSVTVPRVVTTGPRGVSPHGLVRSALGCPRQFESVAGPGGPTCMAAPDCLSSRLGLPLARLQRLR